MNNWMMQIKPPQMFLKTDMASDWLETVPFESLYCITRIFSRILLVRRMPSDERCGYTGFSNEEPLMT